MIPDMSKEVVEQLVRKHEDWRGECVNLTASENVSSPSVKSFLDSDLVQRYADYEGLDPSDRFYRGTKWIAEMESRVSSLACDTYGAKHAEIRPISGHVAAMAVLMALTEPGDTVLEVFWGNHRTATKLAHIPLVDLQVRYLPFNPYTWNVDVDRTLQMVKETRPRIVMLGSSCFLFPHPVRELSNALSSYPETLLIFDGSHVLGLIAAGRFQDPLAEGAQVVCGSTHKTLPGPQGGIILTNDDELRDRIALVVQPDLVANHHLARIPALGVALLEMRRWGTRYADAVIGNAQCLGQAVQSMRVDVVGHEAQFTESHTILVQTAQYGRAGDIALRLEQANIITSAAALPEDLGGGGIRIGTQEITRLGATETDMEELAQMLVDVITGAKLPVDVRPSAMEYARQFRHCGFTWAAD